MSFSFGFSGDDIDSDQNEGARRETPPAAASSTPQNQAFPVPGRPQLPATHHPVPDLLASLPSRISYSLLDVSLEGAPGAPATAVQLPRRELWDVRVQLMAEDDELAAAGDGDDHVDNGGLGKHDVKTGIYEGGFKSWESSVDLVKVLAAQDHLSASPDDARGLRVVELGCGTGLPSLALFQWIMAMDKASRPRRRPCHLVLADYNPSVLRLVTLPNFLLAWALQHRAAPALSDALSMEGEFEITPETLESFQQYLAGEGIRLSFLSGAWSPEFLELLYASPALAAAGPASHSSWFTLLMGAETIYSPFALQAFTEVLFAIMEREKSSAPAPASAQAQALAYVAAKCLYFGVGGSLTDFIDGARARGALISELSEETEGVRRGVISCVLPQ